MSVHPKKPKEFLSKKQRLSQSAPGSARNCTKPDQKVFKWLIDKGYECFRFEQEKENTWVPHEDCIFYNPEKHIHIKQELDELRAHIKNLKENSKNA